MRTLLLLILVAATLAACSRPSGSEAPPRDLVTAPTPEIFHQPIPEGDLALTLFPDRDWLISFRVQDYLQESSGQEEHLLRDGDRVVAVANDKPYAQWLITNHGVWRPDPKGSGVLLRFLPPALKHGETWRQRAGNADVWFRLEKSREYCLTPDNHPAEGKCWDVTVLNSGERTKFTFAPGLGVIKALSVNYANPDDSFDKDSVRVKTDTLATEKRTAYLGRAVRPSFKEEDVIQGTEAEFWAAVARLPGVQSVEADLEGDGSKETVLGQLDEWSAAPMDVLDESGRLLGSTRVTGYDGHRISLVRFDGDQRTRLLRMTRINTSTSFVGMTDILARPNWIEDHTRGWDYKSEGTLADRVKVAPNGVITVEWDMGDPAGHTRFREYRAKDIEIVSERFVPTRTTLVYPTTPNDLLQAVFVARWMGIEDEIPRYFATSEGSRAFAESDAISRPNYEPGTTSFVKVTVESQAGCHLNTEPAPLGKDGTAPFLAEWSGYEWWGAVWGKVTFASNVEGRLVIQNLTIDGNCSSSL